VTGTVAVARRASGGERILGEPEHPGEIAARARRLDTRRRFGDARAVGFEPRPNRRHLGHRPLAEARGVEGRDVLARLALLGRHCEQFAPERRSPVGAHHVTLDLPSDGARIGPPTRDQLASCRSHREAPSGHVERDLQRAEDVGLQRAGEVLPSPLQRRVGKGAVVARAPLRHQAAGVGRHGERAAGAGDGHGLVNRERGVCPAILPMEGQGGGEQDAGRAKDESHGSHPTPGQ
jgi:hypothetical protein